MSQLLEGYGQTETTAVITCGIPGDMSPGNVGSLMPGVEMKLVDVPDMNYFAKNGQGEVKRSRKYIIKGKFVREQFGFLYIFILSRVPVIQRFAINCKTAMANQNHRCMRM